MVAALSHSGQQKQKRLATRLELRGVLPFRLYTGFYDCVKDILSIGILPTLLSLKSGKTDDRPWLGSKPYKTPLGVVIAESGPGRRIGGTHFQYGVSTFVCLVVPQNILATCGVGGVSHFELGYHSALSRHRYMPCVAIQRTLLRLPRSVA